MIRKYQLKGLDCAACASKIEKKLNKLDKIDKAEINFFKQMLIIEVKKEEV